MDRPSFVPFLVVPVLLLAFAPVCLNAEEAAEKKDTAEKKDAPEKKAEDNKGPTPIDLTGWESEDKKYTNPVETERIDADGKKQMKITYKGGETDKAVVCKSVDKMKLPGKGVLHFCVLNPNDKAVQVSVALKTGDAWTFHESQRIEIASSKEEFVDVSIDLTASTFKSEATKWKNTGALAHADAIKSLQLAVYNGKQDGTVTVKDMSVAAKQ